MNIKNVYILDDRAILYINGEDAKEFQKKLNLAKNRMYCNYAFYFGATADNANELADLKNLDGCCGIKLFAGSSTGNLLVAD